MVLAIVQKYFDLQRHKIKLKVSENELFMPNATTRLFSKTVCIKHGDVVFDIGSGVGPLAIWAAKELSSLVYAVEIVHEQVELLRQNILDNGVVKKVHAFEGKFFDPIPSGIKADVIIADVSGIAEGPARALGWYPPSIPTGGLDGTEVIIPMLERAENYLAPEGKLYFPVAIGLSDDKKIMDAAKARFRSLEAKIEPVFPLTPQQAESIMKYKTELPFLHLETKGTRSIWKGAIYEARKPIFLS